MSITALVLDACLGAAIGFLGGLFGVGGGIIAIPILGLIFGFNQQVAQGTATVLIVPNVLLGLWRYYKRGGLDVHYALVLAPTAMVFTYAAAEVAVGLHSSTLRAAFGVFVPPGTRQLRLPAGLGGNRAVQTGLQRASSAQGQEDHVRRAGSR